MTTILGVLKKKKTPQQIVQLSLEALTEENWASLSKRLSSMKEILYGEEGKEPVESKCNELSFALQNKEVMQQLIRVMPDLPFETRKDLSQVFSNLMRKNHNHFADYVVGNQSMVTDLILCYENPDIAILCGSMLRECIRYEQIAKDILSSDLLWNFFTSYVHVPNFDVASDAFTSLKDLLVRHKLIATEFLTTRFDEAFANYNILLDSENFVTRRQSLKLLGEILLDRSNFSVMMKYICDKDNLKKMMNLLRDPSPSIQFEAFHVFKVFVANPRKPPEIVKILVKNRVKLMAYLENFHKEREDERFQEEKGLLVTTLEDLECVTSSVASSEAGSHHTSRDLGPLPEKPVEGNGSQRVI